MYNQNNGYYMSYQPYAPQNGAVPDMLAQQKMQYQMPAIPKNDMLWVLNENEATSYPVAPGNSVILWDKNQDTVYVKSVNMQGVPSIRILDYTERIEQPTERENTPKSHECKCADKFVPMATYNALVEQIDVLRAKVEAMALQLKPKAKKEEVENG